MGLLDVRCSKGHRAGKHRKAGSAPAGSSSTAICRPRSQAHRMQLPLSQVVASTLSGGTEPGCYSSLQHPHITPVHLHLQIV